MDKDTTLKKYEELGEQARKLYNELANIKRERIKLNTKIREIENQIGMIQLEELERYNDLYVDDIQRWIDIIYLHNYLDNEEGV